MSLSRDSESRDMKKHLLNSHVMHADPLGVFFVYSLEHRTGNDHKVLPADFKLPVTEGVAPVSVPAREA